MLTASQTPVSAPGPTPAGTGAYSRRVFLLHGLGRRWTAMKTMGQACRARGYDAHYFAYPSLRTDITTAARRLHDMIRTTGDGARVHFVTHSLGGMVVRRLLRLYGADRVGALVMLAPPSNGSALARHVTRLANVLGPAGRELASKSLLDDLCAVPSRDACVIAGTGGNDWRNPATWLGSRRLLEAPHDGTVSLAEARLEGLPLHEVPACHTFIPAHPEAIRLALDFIHNVCARTVP